MHQQLVRLVALVAVLAAPFAARGDDQELYTLIQLEPSSHHFTDPVRGEAEASAWGAGAGLTAYYGLTNTLHFGGALRVARAKNVAFDDVTVISSGGTSNTGRLFADTLSFSVGALALYRLDTGRPLAPMLSLEGGLVRRSYTNVALTPNGASYGLPVDDNSETLAYGRLTLSLEYRFWQRWIASVGLAGQLEPSGLMPWQISVPISVGMIW
jgi:hypothetical protein